MADSPKPILRGDIAPIIVSHLGRRFGREVTLCEMTQTSGDSPINAGDGSPRRHGSRRPTCLDDRPAWQAGRHNAVSDARMVPFAWQAGQATHWPPRIPTPGGVGAVAAGTGLIPARPKGGRSGGAVDEMQVHGSTSIDTHKVTSSSFLGICPSNLRGISTVGVPGLRHRIQLSD